MDDSLLAPVRLLAGWIGYQAFFSPCEGGKGGRANWRSRFAAATRVTTSSCRWRLGGCEVASSLSIKAGFLSTGSVGGPSGIDVTGVVVPALNAADIASAGRSSMLHLKS